MVSQRFESVRLIPPLNPSSHGAFRFSFVPATLTRVAVQDFYFSNGVRIPAGEMVSSLATPVHQDAKYYPDPSEFQPWRFYDLARAEEEASGSGRPTAKYDMVTPSKTFLTWGLGRHAWYVVHVFFALPFWARLLTGW